MELVIPKEAHYKTGVEIDNPIAATMEFLSSPITYFNFIYYTTSLNFKAV